MLDIHTSIIIPDDTYTYENIPYLFLCGWAAFANVGVDSQENQIPQFLCLSTVMPCKYVLSRFVSRADGKHQCSVFLVANSCIFADYL